MPKTAITIILLLISQPLLYIPAQCAVDFCHADPRIEYHVPMKCKPTRHFVYLSSMDRNPFHALHDWVWGATYYLLHCTQHRQVMLSVNSPWPAANLSQCGYGDDVFPPLAKREEVDVTLWGLCVLHIVTRALKVDLEISYDGRRIWPSNAVSVFMGAEGGGDGTCEYRTVLGVKPGGFGDDGLAIKVDHFREMRWYGRECGGSGKHCNDSGLVLLYDEYKRVTLRMIRETVWKFFNVTQLKGGRRSSNKVHMLIYDRRDAGRREWVNARGVYNTFRDDGRLDIQFIHKMPLSLRDQVILYKWADVVVAPHGAAMSNTLFMADGGEIVEIWAFCDHDVAFGRYVAKGWTGWHVAALGLNLRYVQCHRAGGRYKKKEELLRKRNGQFVHERHKVWVKEVVAVVAAVVERMAVGRGSVSNVDRGGRVKMTGMNRTLLSWKKL